MEKSQNKFYKLKVHHKYSTDEAEKKVQACRASPSSEQSQNESCLMAFPCQAKAMCLRRHLPGVKKPCTTAKCVLLDLICSARMVQLYLQTQKVLSYYAP